MDDLKTKLRNLPPLQKFLIRIFYPLSIYTIVHLLFIAILGINDKLIQALFLLFWGVVEWYFFLSIKKD
jgi:hypothetical protein